MSRTWDEGSKFPADKPALVDDDGITWIWIPDDPDDDWSESGYLRRQITMQRVLGAPEGSGVALGHLPRAKWEWLDMLAEYGPFREATAEEARHMTITYRTVTPAPAEPAAPEHVTESDDVKES